MRMRSMTSRAWIVLLGSIACGGEAPREGPPAAAEVGALRVRWTLEDSSGATLTCGALGIARARVAAGGMPVEVACGEPELVTFERLSPGRYPVVVRLIAGTDTVLDERSDNVTVEAGATAEHVARFVFAIDSFDTGDLELVWRIDGEPPERRCESVGATEVLFEAREGSIEEFRVSAPCADGRVLIEDLNRGDYVVRASLRNETGVIGTQTRQRTVQVLRGERIAESFEFGFAPTELASLLGLWTVTGSAARDACGAIGGERVDLQLFTQNVPNPVAIATGTAACALGSILLEGIGPGPSYRATFRLFDSFGVQIASKIAHDLTLPPAETASVSVDFVPR